jgi:hypothetical protein
LGLHPGIGFSSDVRKAPDEVAKLRDDRTPGERRLAAMTSRRIPDMLFPGREVESARRAALEKLGAPVAQR